MVVFNQNYYAMLALQQSRLKAANQIFEAEILKRGKKVVFSDLSTFLEISKDFPSHEVAGFRKVLKSSNILWLCNCLDTHN